MGLSIVDLSSVSLFSTRVRTDELRLASMIVIRSCVLERNAVECREVCPPIHCLSRYPKSCTQSPHARANLLLRPLETKPM